MIHISQKIVYQLEKIPGLVTSVTELFYSYDENITQKSLCFIIEISSER
jgi:hypothetical protein